jgi:serine protease immune response integrator
MVSAIIGGSVADPERYPYYTRVNITYSVSGKKAIGGTLIAPDVILTIVPWTHYDESDEDVIVEIMAWVNRTSTGETGYEHERKVRFWLPHPDYNESTADNNIALLFLDDPVRGVRMPALNKDKAIPVTDESLTELGMGVIEDSPGDIRIYPDNLMEVDLGVTSFEVCENASTPPPIDEAQIFCAGGNRKGSCWSDFGNPMLDLSKRRVGHADNDVLVGVSSYISFASYDDPHPECVAVGYPSGFTRVAYYSDWIESNVRKHSRGSIKRSKKSQRSKDNRQQKSGRKGFHSRKPKI